MLDYPPEADDDGDIGVSHDVPAVKVHPEGVLETEVLWQDDSEIALEDVELDEPSEERDSADIGAVQPLKSNGGGSDSIQDHTPELPPFAEEPTAKHSRRASKRLSMNSQNLEAALASLSTEDFHERNDSTSPAYPSLRLPEQVEDVEDVTPFESIPLSTTPSEPVTPSDETTNLPSLPTSPAISGRASASHQRPSTESSRHKALPTSPNQKPRLHAPPAIPHSRTLSASSSPGPIPPPTLGSKASSSKPSAFEKVRNVTRPAYLPPKPKDEDDAHLRVWEDMMEQSKAAGAYYDLPFVFVLTFAQNSIGKSSSLSATLRRRKD